MCHQRFRSGSKQSKWLLSDTGNSERQSRIVNLSTFAPHKTVLIGSLITYANVYKRAEKEHTSLAAHEDNTRVQ
jgi:hypothetical protein